MHVLNQLEAARRVFLCQSIGSLQAATYSRETPGYDATTFARFRFISTSPQSTQKYLPSTGKQKTLSIPRRTGASGTNEDGQPDSVTPLAGIPNHQSSTAGADHIHQYRHVLFLRPITLAHAGLDQSPRPQRLLYIARMTFVTSSCPARCYLLNPDDQTTELEGPGLEAMLSRIKSESNGAFKGLFQTPPA